MSIKADVQTLITNLEHLAQVVQVPDGDYSSTALNSSEILPRLEPLVQDLVIEVVDLAFETLTQCGNDDRELNARARREFVAMGGRVIYQQDQYDPFKKVGCLVYGNVALDLSDTPPTSYDD